MHYEHRQLPMRMRYICNDCGIIHDSYWKDLDKYFEEDGCFTKGCKGNNITKIDLTVLSEKEMNKLNLSVKKEDE